MGWRHIGGRELISGIGKAHACLSCPSDWSTTRERSLLSTSVWCASASPSSHGSPACLMPVHAAAPVPPSPPEMTMWSDLALATPAATTPTPTCREGGGGGARVGAAGVGCRVLPGRGRRLPSEGRRRGGQSKMLRGTPSQIFLAIQTFLTSCLLKGFRSASSQIFLTIQTFLTS